MSGPSPARWAGVALALVAALFPFLVLALNSLRPPEDFLRRGAGLWPATVTL